MQRVSVLWQKFGPNSSQAYGKVPEMSTCTSPRNVQGRQASQSHHTSTSERLGVETKKSKQIGLIQMFQVGERKQTEQTELQWTSHARLFSALRNVPSSDPCSLPPTILWLKQVKQRDFVQYRTMFVGRAMTDCSKISTAEGAAEALRHSLHKSAAGKRGLAAFSGSLCSRALRNTRAGIPHRPCQPVGKPVWVRSPSAAAPQLNTLILPVRRQHRCCTLGLFLISLTNLWEMSSRV